MEIKDLHINATSNQGIQLNSDSYGTGGSNGNSSSKQGVVIIRQL
jgi:hypothetical protein